MYVCVCVTGMQKHRNQEEGKYFFHATLSKSRFLQIILTRGIYSFFLWKLKDNENIVEIIKVMLKRYIIQSLSDLHILYNVYLIFVKYKVRKTIMYFLTNRVVLNMIIVLKNL